MSAGLRDDDRALGEPVGLGTFMEVLRRPSGDPGMDPPLLLLALLERGGVPPEAFCNLPPFGELLPFIFGRGGVPPSPSFLRRPWVGELAEVFAPAAMVPLFHAG